MAELQPIEIDVFLQRPIPVRIIAEDGTAETIQLPRLGTDGLLPWLNEVTAERKAAFQAAYAGMKLDARQKADAEFSADMNSRAVITDLNAPAQTPAGIKRILALSLAKTNLSPERQSEALAQILMSAHIAHSLAAFLSTLFATNERRPVPDPAKTIAENAQEAFPGAKVGGSPLPEGAESGQNSPAPEPLTTGSLPI